MLQLLLLLHADPEAILDHVVAISDCEGMLPVGAGMVRWEPANQAHQIRLIIHGTGRASSGLTAIGLPTSTLKIDRGIWHWDSSCSLCGIEMQFTPGCFSRISGFDTIVDTSYRTQAQGPGELANTVEVQFDYVAGGSFWQT